MNYKLGKCLLHGEKQLLAETPISQVFVCLRCCVEFYTGHHLRNLVREGLCIADTRSVTAPSV